MSEVVQKVRKPIICKSRTKSLRVSEGKSITSFTLEGMKSRSQLLRFSAPHRLKTMRIPYSILKASEKVLGEWSHATTTWKSAPVRVGAFDMTCTPIVVLQHRDDPKIIQYVRPEDLHADLSALELVNAPDVEAE
jgi:hypothetical protein